MSQYVVGPAGLDVSRFLPLTPIRVVVDHRLADATETFPEAVLEDRAQDGRKELRFRDLGFLETLVPRMLEKARGVAEGKAPERIGESLERMREVLGTEVARLRSLAEVNEHLDPGEVRAAEARIGKRRKRSPEPGSDWIPCGSSGSGSSPRGPESC